MPTEIRRKGFCISNGRFVTETGGERISADRLKAAFLPRITNEGQRFIKTREGDQFVRNQFQHYGVEYHPAARPGRGTLVLQKAIGNGLFEQVPAWILDLEKEMRAEWLESNRDELGPHYHISKHFANTNNMPDKSITPAPKVVTVPIAKPTTSKAADEVDRLLKAADTSGLYHAVVYIGWDRIAVERAARDAKAKIAAAEEARRKAAAIEASRAREAEWARKDEERERERAAKHEAYLAQMARWKRERKLMPGPAPNGEYIIDCEQMEGQWPDRTKDMRMLVLWDKDIGVYLASFDFGVLEGVMIFWARKGKLDRLGPKTEDDDGESEEDGDSEEEDDRGSEEDWDSEEDGGSEEGDSEEEGDFEEEGDSEEEGDYDEEEDFSDENAAIPAPTSAPAANSSKRKATSPPAGRKGQAAKKVKAIPKKPKKFFLRLRCREVDTGQIYSSYEEGTITWEKNDFATFRAQVNGLPGVGSAIEFTGRKISYRPIRLTTSWDDYSEVAAERANRGRWGGRGSYW